MLLLCDVHAAIKAAVPVLQGEPESQPGAGSSQEERLRLGGLSDARPRGWMELADRRRVRYPGGRNVPGLKA